MLKYQGLGINTQAFAEIIKSVAKCLFGKHDTTQYPKRDSVPKRGTVPPQTRHGKGFFKR